MWLLSREERDVTIKRPGSLALNTCISESLSPCIVSDTIKTRFDTPFAMRGNESLIHPLEKSALDCRSGQANRLLYRI